MSFIRAAELAATAQRLHKITFPKRQQQSAGFRTRGNRTGTQNGFAPTQQGVNTRNDIRFGVKAVLDRLEYRRQRPSWVHRVIYPVGTAKT